MKSRTNTTWSMPSWRVKRTLERNRALLKALRTRNTLAEEAPNEWLARRGFDFHFHTHITTTKEGRLAVMCFDEGYVVESGGVVPLDQEMEERVSTPAPLVRP